MEVGAVDREQRPVEDGRHAVGHRQQPPGHLHRLVDDEGEAEGEQQLGDVAVPVDPAQPVHLDERAEAPHRTGASTSAGQKPTMRLIA